MKRILFIHHAGTIGGAPWSLLYTIKALDASSYSAHVLFLEPGKAVELFDKEQYMRIVPGSIQGLDGV